LTQGNVSNRIDAGEVPVEDARQWLLTETAQFFAESSTRDFSFLVMADVFVADDRSAIKSSPRSRPYGRSRNDASPS
jgi:hypothetical protein